MKRALLTVLILVVNTPVSSREVISLTVKPQIVSREHCQFTADAQSVALHVRLTFVNTSRNDIVIQQVNGLNLTIVAKSLTDIDSRVYELNSQPEHFEPEVPKNVEPILLKPGSSYETMEVVSLTVARNASVAAPSTLIRAGRHYLQIGEE